MVKLGTGVCVRDGMGDIMVDGGLENFCKLEGMRNYRRDAELVDGDGSGICGAALDCMRRGRCGREYARRTRQADRGAQVTGRDAAAVGQVGQTGRAGACWTTVLDSLQNSPLTPAQAGHRYQKVPRDRAPKGRYPCVLRPELQQHR